jgi:hypothetical protein
VPPALAKQAADEIVAYLPELLSNASDAPEYNAATVAHQEAYADWLKRTANAVNADDPSAGSLASDDTGGGGASSTPLAANVAGRTKHSSFPLAVVLGGVGAAAVLALFLLGGPLRRR